MQLSISALADRPDLADAFWNMPSSWPEFMRHDPIGGLFYANAQELFPDYCLIGQDESGSVVAQAFSIPCPLDPADLPPNGWDAAIRSGVMAKFQRKETTTVSAIEIAIRPDLQGTGLSGSMLRAMSSNAAKHGYAELVAPVRPNGKTDIHEPMSAYAFRTRDDGLPVDPWLRVHVRAGGVIERVAARSMVVPGTLEEWREWTDLPFDTTGPVEVPKALTPVHCSLEHGTAVYVEPNVWVRHRTGA